MIQKQGSWVPYELKPRDVKRRFFVCEQLLQIQNQKGSFYRIVTGDEKWVHYDNPKSRKAWGMPRHASTSTARFTTIHGVARPVSAYLETLKWEILAHSPYSPNVAPFDYHLFLSMAHGLARQNFRSYEEVKKLIDLWIASKDASFFRDGIRQLPER